MLFANPVSLASVTQQSRDSSAMSSFDFGSCCARIGRGGRLIMSRCQPFTYEPLDVQQPAEEQQKLPFDLSAPYLASAQANQQLPRPLSIVKTESSPGARHSKQPSPARQAAVKQQQQPQHQPAGAGRMTAGSQAQQQQQPGQTQPLGLGAGQNAGPQAAPAQPALQQTRQQQAQAQSQAQLIEMPIQPGASQTAPTPAKSKVCFY